MVRSKLGLMYKTFVLLVIREFSIKRKDNYMHHKKLGHERV